MGNQPFWQLPKAVGPSQQRIDRMTEALVWLRRSENSFVIFGDSDRTERYVQFAVDATGSEKMASLATVAVAVPLLVAAGIASPDENIGSVVPGTADRSPWWAAGGGYFGEPDHEPLLMEVGSPTDPPDPMHSAEASALTTLTCQRIRPPLSATAIITSGTPCPRASRAHL